MLAHIELQFCFQGNQINALLKILQKKRSKRPTYFNSSSGSLVHYTYLCVRHLRYALYKFRNLVEYLNMLSLSSLSHSAS